MGERAAAATPPVKITEAAIMLGAAAGYNESHAERSP
jgi:hypothetical protein